MSKSEHDNATFHAPVLLLLLAVVLLVVPHARPTYSCSQFALAPHSQWKVETQQGVSWLITPCGERFFSIGVNVLNGGYPSRIYQGRLAYHWARLTRLSKLGDSHPPAARRLGL